MLDYNEGYITGNGESFAGEYRGKLDVDGICLIAVVCDWFIIYSQGGNSNVFFRLFALTNDQNRFGFVFRL